MYPFQQYANLSFSSFLDITLSITNADIIYNVILNTFFKKTFEGYQLAENFFSSFLDHSFCWWVVHTTPDSGISLDYCIPLFKFLRVQRDSHTCSPGISEPDISAWSCQPPSFFPPTHPLVPEVVAESCTSLSSTSHLLSATKYTFML